MVTEKKSKTPTGHFPLGSMEEMSFAKPSLFASTFSCTTNLKFPVIFDMLPNVSQVQRIMFRVLLKTIIESLNITTNNFPQQIPLFNGFSYIKKPNYITASVKNGHFESKNFPSGVAGPAPSSQNSAKVVELDAASKFSTRGVFSENSPAAIFVVQ